MLSAKTNKPLISVIVPIYNCARYLPQCIESILAQTYTNLEIILVDDGSTDNSRKICNDYAAMDLRIKVIHQANAGVSVARNIGLKWARGEYIGFVDADDYIAKDMYEYLYSLIFKYQTKISICNYYEVRNSQITICADSPNDEQKLSTKQALLLLLRVLSVWHQLFHREVFNNISFDPSISYAEDLYVSFQAFKHVREIAYGADPMYYYRQHSTSVTCSSKWNPKHLGYITATNAILSYARENNIMELIAKFQNSQLNMVISFLRDCLVNGPFDMYSANALRVYLKKNISLLLKSNIKPSKKLFALCSFINFNLAKQVYILLQHNKK